MLPRAHTVTGVSSPSSPTSSSPMVLAHSRRTLFVSLLAILKAAVPFANSFSSTLQAPAPVCGWSAISPCRNLPSVLHVVQAESHLHVILCVVLPVSSLPRREKPLQLRRLLTCTCSLLIDVPMIQVQRRTQYRLFGANRTT